MNAVVSSQGSAGYHRDVAKGPGDRYQHMSRDVGGILKEHKQPWDTSNHRTPSPLEYEPHDVTKGDPDDGAQLRHRSDRHAISSTCLERTDDIDMGDGGLIDGRWNQNNVSSDTVIARKQTRNLFRNDEAIDSECVSGTAAGRSLSIRCGETESESLFTLPSSSYCPSFQKSPDAVSNSPHMLDSRSSRNDVSTESKPVNLCRPVSSISDGRLPASRISGGLEELDALFQRYDLLNQTSRIMNSNQIVHTEPFSDRVNRSSPARRHQDEQHHVTVDRDVTSEKTLSDVNSGSPKRDSENQQVEDMDAGLQIPNRTYSLMYKKPKKCKYCDFTSASKETLWTHLRLHVPADKLLYCSLCPFVTELKHHWDTHSRNHDKRKPFKCSLCDYSAVNQSMINSHLKTHSSIRPYVCRYPACDFKCKFSTQLRSHCEKKHGEKQTSHGRKSAVRRGHVSSARELRSDITATVTKTPVVTGEKSLEMASPPMNDSNSGVAIGNRSPVTTVTSPLWNPHLTATAGRFGDLPYRTRQNISTQANSPQRAGLSAAYGLSSPYRMPTFSPTPHLIPGAQFSPLTAKIGAIQFDSPVAMRSLDLQQQQQPRTVDTGRQWGQLNVVAMRNIVAERIPMADQKSPPISSVTDELSGVNNSFSKLSNSQFVKPPPPFQSRTPELTPTAVKTHQDFHNTIHDGLGRASARAATSAGSGGVVEATPLDLTKKHVIKAEPVNDMAERTSRSEQAVESSRISCRKQSRRKGVAHKLDVVSANRFTTEDDVAEVIVPDSLPSSSAAVDLCKRQTRFVVNESSSSKDHGGVREAIVCGRLVPGETSGTRSTAAGIECQFCDCVFHYSVMHTMHMEFHGQLGDPWQCNKCGVKCNNRLEFNDHIATAAHR